MGIHLATFIPLTYLNTPPYSDKQFHFTLLGNVK